MAVSKLRTPDSIDLLAGLKHVSSPARDPPLLTQRSDGLLNTAADKPRTPQFELELLIRRHNLAPLPGAKTYSS